MEKQGTCPLTMKQVMQEYFVENRTRVLEIASFLDRLERASGSESPADDFRMVALQRALTVLNSSDPDKINQILLIFSDPTTDPKINLDTKSALGAWNPKVTQ